MRVRSNIEALPSILDDILRADGCTIQEFSYINNTGKRYKKLKSDGEMKRKPQKRDRKSTLVLRPCHPDLQPALDKLLAGNPPDAVIDRINDEVATANTLFDDGAAQDDNDEGFCPLDEMSDD